MKRLSEANAPFTGALQAATLRYAACIKKVHEQDFNPQSASVQEGQEMNSAVPVLPLAIQSEAPAAASLPVGAHWNTQTDWVTGKKVKSGLEKVVLTTKAVPTAGPGEDVVDYEMSPINEEDGGDGGEEGDREEEPLPQDD